MPLDRRRRTKCIGLAVLVVVLGATLPAGAASAPDGRQYELVSPPEKNGGDIVVDAQRTWAASDGDAVAFASLAGFGDVAGTGIATDYFAQRLAEPAGTHGWAVRAITPAQAPLPITLRTSGFEPMDEAFTADLDTNVFQSYTPLTGDPYVAGVANLYVRRGLRSGAAPSVELATPCPLCALTATPLAPLASTRYNMFPKVAGISQDGAHVLFESALALTREATDGTSSGAVNLYAYANGGVQDVGILPDGTAAASALAGQGAQGGQATAGSYTTHTFSSDGMRAIFTSQPASAAQSCNLVGGTYACGDIYLRDMSTSPPTTVQVNSSERTPAATHLPAIFWDASADGRRVFFTTGEPLTNDASNEASYLYMFDASAPAGSRLTLISAQDPSLAGGFPPSADAVIGASDDGRSVYFTSSQALLPGDPPLDLNNQGIYLWRDPGNGPPQLRFIAPLRAFGDTVTENRVAGSGWAAGQRLQARMSPDGRYLLFATIDGSGVLSRRGGTDYDHGRCNEIGVPGCRELYLYDASADTMQCATCRPDGQTATSSATDNVAAFNGAALSATYLNHALTVDGSGAPRVFFTTPEALVPEDVNGTNDAYEWENGQVHLLTDGQSVDSSYFLDASPDGADAFVVTRARLSAWDTDGAYDLYDVRQPLPGHPAGVPDPPPAPPVCTPGSDCSGATPPPPAPPSIGSVGFVGGGNLSQHFPKPIHCRAGTVKKRTSRGIRCVRRAKRKPSRCPRSRAHRKRCPRPVVRARRRRSAR